MHMEEAVWQRCRNGRQLNWRRKQSVRRIKRPSVSLSRGRHFWKSWSWAPRKFRSWVRAKWDWAWVSQVLGSCCWESSSAVGVWYLLDTDPGHRQLDTKHQSNSQKCWLQLLPQGMWHWWLWGHQWWCWEQMMCNWSSIFIPCLFSNGFPVLCGELHQIPLSPCRKSCYLLAGKVGFLSLSVFTHKMMSRTRTAGKIDPTLMCSLTSSYCATVGDSGGNFHLKQTKHKLKIAYTPLLKLGLLLNTYCPLLISLSALTPRTSRVVSSYCCTALVHHTTCSL